jgi:pilus assembly protein FimV
MRTVIPALLAGSVLVLHASDASAMSFGRVRSAVTLGQALNIAVPVTLDEGEPLTVDCIRAEVQHGDASWPANVLRYRMTQGEDEQQRVVRVSSIVPVEEPVVVITVHVGCPTRLSRGFTLFADPPVALATTTAPPATAGAARPNAEGASSAVAPPRAARETRTAAVAPAAPRPRPVAPTDVDVATRDAAPQPPRNTRTTTAPAPRPRAAAPAPAERPRLQLDGATVARNATTDTATPASDPAREAALAEAQKATAAAEAKLEALRADMARIQASAKAQADSLTQLQARVQGQLAQRDEGSNLLPWIAGLAGLSLLTTAWLAMRLRRLREEQRRSPWWNRTGVGPSVMEDYRESELERATGGKTAKPSRAFEDSRAVANPSGPARDVAAVASAAVVAKAAARAPTASSSSTSAALVEAQRAVSVDEQIDLEQQADFFIALGHDDAAIDLLLAHLRNTGGSAPMPYLKLLEMYRRRGERDDYELMRRRFNQRFNSVAPQWDDDASAGRDLEDYPGHVATLQSVWKRPLDAMAELEAMAFGRVDGQELLDLPAYQDVLFLYQTARTLHEDGRDVADVDVDVLLPLGGQGGSGQTGSGLVGSGLAAPMRQSEGTGRVDLDISTTSGPLTPYRPSIPGPMPMIDLDLPPLDDKKK